ncbi:MAG: UvrB/UvrC motif-containing protein [Clostridia bacterium]
MLCEECKKNQATVMITVTSGDEVTTRHLCSECMKSMELSFAQGDMQSFLSSILSLLGSAQTPQAELTCSNCGLTYSEFERTGKLGCAQCYRDFAEQLKPLLQRIHGRTQHAGRVPPTFVKEAGLELEQQMEDLRQKMEQAVASENFEEAAKYRDELRALTVSKEADCK